MEVWREDFKAFAASWQAHIDFVEGWPSQITIAASAFLRCAEEIVVTIPLRHLNLTAIADAPTAVDVGAMAQIATLQVCSQPWNREAIQALADSEHLRSLRWLDLSQSNLTDADVETLAASPRLREVAYLNVEDNPCRNPVDASTGYGVDAFTGLIVAESLWFPDFGRELQARHGSIPWLPSLENFMETYPNRYQF